MRWQRLYLCFLIRLLSDAGWGHGGGDVGLVNDMYDILTGAKTEYTSLEESVESHLMGIAAEESSLNSGNINLYWWIFPNTV